MTDALRRRGNVAIVGLAASARHALARRIVTLASAGERNPDRLCDKALVAVGVLPQ
jgi:hypothetical protein